MPLPFGSTEQLIKFEDRLERITATFVSEGTTPAGSTWAMNPVPMCGEETRHTKDASGNLPVCRHVYKQVHKHVRSHCVSPYAIDGHR